ncbi:cobalt-precorrin-7 (C(5))-methyltransferase [Listeria cossartiae subsp. cayugensis]|uniref:cobalt-precorrin-7 (C(5))-methyltransferase n=1 Tax=Listeria cossartiae TaxID=2838249 RepID=UPI001627E39E|nr:cobalt-precorrin-7 (C(5))-methyltransferase [Listeria cossartiae]MBC1543667.1 cobalt-precorrin-7 (C(5))-methyltransferase [Listeria cossartiae subsp. cossartiae]MDS9999588.1 cobalt-precorrin-7 (C(5))-methyltransferase [Listeria cossartiae subsp. cayugensis]MDT0007965.1 cobalt-precorrin-7 (C(5))-methyltransferase [Listeria cossartiae subsp. cayugensis]MDT0029620.1 cobalt-precorrin-7 (C(5))-methyltransferase [Listeria cossartiae subsp. cayugensis]MDT0037735.1 cobalt-precorrin-7 (C(5))-methylt
MITVVGIGPGDTKLLINEAKLAISTADIVYGSTRQLQEIAALTTATPKLLPKKLAELKNIPHQNQQVVILASGDPLLYGIGNWAMANFAEDVRIIPGISAIQMMFHQIKLPMNDCFITSSHGKTPNFDFLLQHEKVAMVTDTIIGPYEIAAEILKRNLNKMMFIGENLSAKEERIHKLKPEDVAKKYDMNVVVIIDEG